jgi:hypothetical protein
MPNLIPAPLAKLLFSSGASGSVASRPPCETVRDSGPPWPAPVGKRDVLIQGKYCSIRVAAASVPPKSGVTIAPFERPAPPS